MKKIKDILLCVAVAMGVASCASEAPFSEGGSNDTGRFLTSSLSVDVKSDEALVRASSSLPDVNDFKVVFYKEDGSVAFVNGKQENAYRDLPEVVILPVGTYSVQAYYGENQVNAFSAPYYKGESESFTIEKDVIVDNISPVVCKLANVKVSIIFDDALKALMSPDAKVSVSVGNSGSLDFTKATEESGYFRYVEGSATLAATFSGTIDGDPVNEVKTYDNVAPGNHYKVTFKLHMADPNEPGDIDHGNGGVNIDASVTTVTINENGELGNSDDEYMDDPDHNDEPENPVDPDDPVNPVDPSAGPTITAQEPINLDIINEVTAESTVILNVHSDTGLTGFKVIIPNTIDLDGMLPSELDLIDPDDSYIETLHGFKLLKPEQTTLKGEKDVPFDISQFMELLALSFPGRHDFTLVVTDAGGSVTQVLKLNVAEM